MTTRHLPHCAVTTAAVDLKRTWLALHSVRGQATHPTMRRQAPTTTARATFAGAIITILTAAMILSLSPQALAQTPAASAGGAASQPTKIYMPYERLNGVFVGQTQAVFMPYAEFQRLWQAAQGAPMGVDGAPAPFLVSTARFSGKVSQELATMDLELTVDILTDQWVQVPLGLSSVAVSEASFVDTDNAKVRPLLRVEDGKYVMLTRGKGRRVLKLQFVRQLVTQPGLNILGFGIPQAAITTLDLLIPEENMKVDVRPMLAATTFQVDMPASTTAPATAAAPAKATKLQAFLGSSDTVQLSWKPKTQAASELEPVVIADQVQHIDIGEALMTSEVKINYDIRRRGVDTFVLQLPAEFRITAVDGADIAKWDILGGAEAKRPAGPQVVQVKLFSPAKDSYSLTVKMERFLKDAQVQAPLSPIVTQQALRQTGLIALTHSPRRSVELREEKNLARVDTGRLPDKLRNMAGVTAYRFVAADYSGTLAVGTVAPRINVQQYTSLAVTTDRLQMSAELRCQVERTGVYELLMNLPEPWEVTSVGPADVVDDHQFAGKGPQRNLRILLKREMIGAFNIQIQARQNRSGPEQDVALALPLVEDRNIQTYSGQLMLQMPDSLRAEVSQLNQLQPLPLARTAKTSAFAGTTPVMGFEFKAADRTKPLGASFRIALRPSQVSATVYRLVNIQSGWVEQQAIVNYRVLYAPVDTFYLKVPAELASTVQIAGANIKEKPRTAALPADQAETVTTAPAQGVAATQTGAATRPSDAWAYFKIVLQSPITGDYQLTVNLRQPFRAGEGDAQQTTVKVEPILAAGKLSDQSGCIAVAKDESLAIREPKMEGLIPADAGSAQDLPYEPYRRIAVLAFKYNAPPFVLELPVAVQKEAAVFTTIATAAVVEQVLGADSTMNTHAMFLLATSRGDRLPLVLPPASKVFSVLINGAEAPVEIGASADERIVRLPPTAGQVSRVVLEVTYGQDKATATALAAPTLGRDVPIQQTLWRLWTPLEDLMLCYDRDFAPIEPYQADSMLASLSQEFRMPVAFKLSPQGKSHDFLRQGAPRQLSVTLAGRELTSIVLWAAIIVIGAAMLKLAGFHRLLIVLAAALLVAVLNLFAPLMAGAIVTRGKWAAILVLVLWVGHWLLRRKAARQAAVPAIHTGKVDPAAQASATAERKGE